MSGSPLGIGRHGHSAVAVNEERLLSFVSCTGLFYFCSAMLVFGGYDGQILSDVIKIQFCELLNVCVSLCIRVCACTCVLQFLIYSHSKLFSTN